MADIDKACMDCGEDVLTGDVCGYCGGPLHPDEPGSGRCMSNHEFECDQNPDNAEYDDGSGESYEYEEDPDEEPY